MPKSPVQTRPKTGATTCTCEWADRANHDSLLTIETDFDAVAELVLAAETWDEDCHGEHCDEFTPSVHDHGPKTVAPFEFAEFAAAAA